MCNDRSLTDPTNLPATAPPIVVNVAQKPPVSTSMAMSAPINGGAALPKSGGWKLIPQYCGTVHSLTVNGCARGLAWAKLLSVVSTSRRETYMGSKPLDSGRLVCWWRLRISRQPWRQRRECRSGHCGSMLDNSRWGWLSRSHRKRCCPSRPQPIDLWDRMDWCRIVPGYCRQQRASLWCRRWESCRAWLLRPKLVSGVRFFILLCYEGKQLTGNLDITIGIVDEVSLCYLGWRGRNGCNGNNQEGQALTQHDWDMSSFGVPRGTITK